MLKEQDFLQWLFQLIVEHAEKTDENERFIRRLEVVDEGMVLHTKDGRPFRIVVQTPSALRRNADAALSRSSDDDIHLPRPDWETLVEACESMLQYLKSLPGRVKQH